MTLAWLISARHTGHNSIVISARFLACRLLPALSPMSCMAVCVQAR
jgi:hypothetical protein